MAVDRWNTMLLQGWPMAGHVKQGAACCHKDRYDRDYIYAPNCHRLGLWYGGGSHISWESTGRTGQRPRASTTPGGKSW
jgi:hypothetical protein